MRSQNNPPPKSSRTRPPATTPEGRENQLIALATDLVEKRLIAGTASAQETVHFLKLGSTQARLEKEMLEKQKELLAAKTESLQSTKRQEELFEKALSAMRSYKGDRRDDDET